MAEAEDYGFLPEEMAVNENLGYPKAFAKLCRDRGFSPYSHGPPFTFIPYVLPEDEAERARDLDEMFPIIDPKAKATSKPKIFVSVLWKQLRHLGNAGFDPAVIRVDGYGNVLYYHADSASPLAWDVDHWFPCSRGGLTVLSNLRILQRQACKRKKNKLEFLVPWWDFQLGISVNQFLSVFASSNSDFRHRAFSFLFYEGENQELNASQIVDSHSFPQHFFPLKEEVGLAPAAIVESRREPCDALVLRQLDYNRKPRPMSPAIAARKRNGNFLKENEDPDFVKNPYQAIVMARDSLKQREETTKMQAEIQKIDDEVNEMKLKNEEEKLAIQDLEMALIKCRRKAEKCRRLAEAQSSYRTMLEKMIRDSMHQIWFCCRSVIYKEQVRLNQAASNALMARLEAQREICDAAEKDLHKKYKQRDDIEKQIRPEWEQGRKRSRIDDATYEERDSKPALYLPGPIPRTPLHKELGVFLEEEQRSSEVDLSANEEEQKQEEKEEKMKMPDNNDLEEKLEEHTKSSVALDEENSIEQRLQKLKISEGKRSYGISFSGLHKTATEEDEETRKQRGRGNVEKWLQMLLENGQQQERTDPLETSENASCGTEEKIIQQLNQKFPQKELKISKVSDSDYKENQLQLLQNRNGWTEKEDRIENEARSVMPTGYKNYSGEACIGANCTLNVEGMERKEQHKKEKKLPRSESARTLRRIPSSPSLLLGIKKGVDYIRKKPMASDDADLAASNSFLKSSIKTIKKAVKL
ncbi:golgin subfamily A member 6-like protein 22 isoform X2 [Glycine soja]|uniref:golgin subfamily A member 6-like protein 22 isoform X2 n=1 Tax=Glycine soja TaxID=3848 RepID=UPI00103D80AA|nr:golgin subfamily A member 6-like protein 22 isoform X2 [Glycine soja]